MYWKLQEAVDYRISLWAWRQRKSIRIISSVSNKAVKPPREGQATGTEGSGRREGCHGLCISVANNMFK
jgi:hypothetical protein